MAVVKKNTPEKPIDGKAVTPNPPVPKEDTVLLELALYTNYTWRGFTYQKGKAYRFSREDAFKLMEVQDHGRNVWSIFKMPKPKAQPRLEVIDTPVEAPIYAEGVDAESAKTHRLDVGSDDELKGLIPDDDDNGTDPDTGEGNQTV